MTLFHFSRGRFFAVHHALGKNVVDIDRRYEVGVNGYGCSGNKSLPPRCISKMDSPL